MNKKSNQYTSNVKRPVLWRHHMAGVLLGHISESDVPGHILFEGVRIWSWSGGRRDCASLAVTGPQERDCISAFVRRDVMIRGSVEIYDTSEENIARGIALAEKG